jgi:hypothetical protein
MNGEAVLPTTAMGHYHDEATRTAHMPNLSTLSRPQA